MRNSQLSRANVSIGDQFGASVFTIYGCGLLFMRIADGLGAACRVADAVDTRRFPEFPQPRALCCPCACRAYCIEEFPAFLSPHVSLALSPAL